MIVSFVRKLIFPAYYSNISCRLLRDRNVSEISEALGKLKTLKSIRFLFYIERPKILEILASRIVFYEIYFSLSGYARADPVSY